MSLYSFCKSVKPLLIYQVSNHFNSYNYYLERHWPSQCTTFSIGKAKLKALLIEK